MKVLIIGFGSIGKRHFEILSSFQMIDAVHVVTKQVVDNILTFKELGDVDSLDIYDYFVIASETSKHHEQLRYLCAKVNDKKILVEKPLYDKQYSQFSCKNEVFTAYNLRFHPAIHLLKKLMKDKIIYSVNAICGQYLPSWRPEQDYRLSYSAKSHQGGGVLRDLSHELDYITWIFGEFDSIEYISTKISDLEIDSDDIFTAIGVTNRKIVFNVTLDYISKVAMRRIVVHTKEKTFIADIVKNTITIYDKEMKEETINLDAVDRNYTYGTMHQSILSGDYHDICSFSDGEKLVKLIDSVKKEEL